MENITLKGKVIISGVIELLTGLHIGGLKETLKIGGTDDPVIKDAFGRIYIPGSSLKGKIRCLLEKSMGKGKVKVVIKVKKEIKEGDKSRYEVKEDKEETYELKDFNTDIVDKLIEEYKSKGYTEDKGYSIESHITALPCSCGDCVICKIFGPHDSKKIEEPRRVVFRDAYLVKEINDNEKNRNNSNNEVIEIGEKKYKILDENDEELNEYLEIKPENIIDRVKGVAQHPRFIERVSAGAKFYFEIVFNVYKKEDKELLKELITGMKLLEDDYLGGSGSRGYGKIKFENLKIVNRPKEYYEGNEKAEKVTDVKDLDELKNLNKLEEKIKEIWNY
ncbi:type III-A CRISPR-associated RAMP protein Csm3 [Methanotorris igneus]|nr:type III-A CRISPR-associated RAMP protein Csm3 [Methanotorris igneus]